MYLYIVSPIGIPTCVYLTFLLVTEYIDGSMLSEILMDHSTTYLCLPDFSVLVAEYIDGGTLNEILMDHSIELSWVQRVKYVNDISAGMVGSRSFCPVSAFTVLFWLASDS